MDGSLKNSIFERAELLPDELKSFIVGNDLKNSIKRIQSTYKLSNDQLNELNTLTALLLTLSITYEEFPTYISNRFPTSETEGNEISELLFKSFPKFVQDALLAYEYYVINGTLDTTEEGRNISSKETPVPPAATQQTPSVNIPNAVQLQSNPVVAQSATQPPKPVPPPKPEPIVKPLRTMEGDIDRIHGYGAYRKMFPDTPEEVAKPVPEPPTPSTHSEEHVHTSTQEGVLEQPPTLTPMPSYTKAESNTGESKAREDEPMVKKVPPPVPPPVPPNLPI